MYQTFSFDQRKMASSFLPFLCLAILIFSSVTALAETSPRENIAQAESEKDLVAPAQKETPDDGESLIHKTFPCIMETNSGWVSAQRCNTISKKWSHAVMVGSFPEKNKKDAEELVARLSDPWDPRVYEVRSGKEKWLVVIAGGYKTPDQASQKAAEFREKQGMAAVTVTISEHLPFIILADAFPSHQQGTEAKIGALITRLRSAGHEAEIYQTADTQAREWSAVLIRAEFRHLEKAFRKAFRLRKKEKRAEVTYKTDDPRATVQGPQLVRSLQGILSSFSVENEEGEGD